MSATPPIHAQAKSVRDLLTSERYGLGYYQREYLWESEEVNELMHDLSTAFLTSYEEGDPRSAVAGYDRYFLGPIITSSRDGKMNLIDGQQRVTTLTLLLIYLYHELSDDPEQAGQLRDLIFTPKYGERSFTLDVDDRRPVMEALYEGRPSDDLNVSESARNLVRAYRDITENFPEDLIGNALPYFADWLIENVLLVDITAFSDQKAYLIFETMNDRGLSLSPTDMLKGYLLANIGDEANRDDAHRLWKQRIQALRDLDKGEDSDAIKAWLRSQYADTVRERKRDAEPGDFDLIGSEFHRWVRDESERLALTDSDSYLRFVQGDFEFYTRWYETLRTAADDLNLAQRDGLECIFYNALHNFTLQFPVLLATLRPEDSREVLHRKLRLSSTYLDIIIHRRIWNFRAINYSTMQYTMFQLMKEIRGLEIEPLADTLLKRLHEDEKDFSAEDRFHRHGTNGRQIHHLLARMIAWLEAESDQPSRLAEYIKRGGRNGYEVEHIWADHFDRHQDEFEHPADFKEYRNRIGGLLLLPKSFNASYGDLEYEKKLKHYFGQNLLARSLNPRCYDHNPGFVQLSKKFDLPFVAHDSFKKADLDARQELYQTVATQIWSPSRLQEIAEQ